MSLNPRRFATVAALLVPALALAAPPSAGQPSLGLNWSDPNLLAPTTERDFDTQLAARLGHPAFVAGTDQPTLSVTWQGTPERCRVELSLSGKEGVEGTRMIESPSGDCQSLVPALLTVSALLVESHHSASTAETAPPAPAPAAPVATTRPVQEAKTSPPRTDAQALLSLGGALSSGFVPKLEMGPAAAATWAPSPYLRLGLAGALFIGHGYGDGPGLSLQHQRAELFTCGMPISGKLALGLCGNVGLHRFHVSGTSLQNPNTHSLGTWSLGAEVRAEWRLTHRLWWVGHAGADVATRSLYFYYMTAGGEAKNIFEQRRVNPVLLLALSLEVP